MLRKKISRSILIFDSEFFDSFNANTMASFCFSDALVLARDRIKEERRSLAYFTRI